MKTILLIMILFSLFSCSSTQDQKELARESWKGRSTKELGKHPYFKHLPIKKVKHEYGLETWIFRDQSRFQSDSYCQSLGGCQGIPIYNCDNGFSIKDDVILGFEQTGSCPGPKVIAP